MGCIGVSQTTGSWIEIRIKQRHESVGLREVLLGELVEVMKDAIRWQSTENFGAEHPAQHGHQQTSGNTLSHHIAHDQSPATTFPSTTDEFRTRGNEIVVITTHLKRWTASSGKLHALNHRTMIGQQLSLNLRPNAQLTINPFMTTGVLQHQIIFDRHTRQIGHQLGMSAMHVGPNQIGRRIKHIQPTATSPANHHRCGKQTRLWQTALNQAIQGQHLGIIGAKSSRFTRLEAR